MTLIETERLLIDTWDHDDWIRFRYICSDPEVMRYITLGEPWSEEQTRSFVKRQIIGMERHGFALWKLIEKESDRLIGFCGLQHMGSTDEVEIGWWLARDRWRMGFAVEAARAVLDHGLQVIGLRRIVAIAHPQNEPSIAVMRKLGMTFEREISLTEIGRPHPHILTVVYYSIKGGSMLQPESISRSVTMIDVSHTVEAGMITYKGLPAPIICDFLSRERSRELYDEGTEFHIGRIDMVANTGTYIDAPFHRYADGKDLSELDLSSLADLDAVVVRVRERAGRAIEPSVFAGLDLRGRAVLVDTGWDSHWRTDAYFEGHPFLTRASAAHLVEQGARLVGIDSYNIDDTTDGSRPAHTLLLGAEIPIVEHLCNLDHLPDAGFRFFAVPVKVKGFGTFPVRAFGLMEEESEGDHEG